jgi:precorrin-6A/cobalt-precorrin-6A reductase
VRLLVLAGTEDGRELADALKQRGHDILVSTLTAYGADLALAQGLQARSGAMDAQRLTDLLKGGAFAALVDATHPYAVQVKEMAKTVCAELALPYLRWQRSSLELEEHPLLHWAADIPAAAQIAAELGGQRILLTTGSNALPEWVSLPALQDKLLFVRVLPTAQVLARCEALGFKPYQIIAAQGPFSQEWDEAMFKQLKIEIVIAKESGQVGGTLEKVQACIGLNIPLILLKRPATEAQACSLAQFIKHLEEIL